MSELFADLHALLPSLRTTLGLTALSFALGFPLAVVAAVVLQGGRTVVRLPLLALIEVLRGMPALLTLYFVYYGLPERGLTLSATWCSCIAFALTFVAYTAPIIAASIAMVPAAHLEAGAALGLGRWTVTSKIVLPQAMKIAMPPLISWTVILFQGTSLAGWVGTNDLFNMAKSQGAQDFHYLYHLALASGFYAALSIPFLLLAARLERSRDRRGLRSLLRALLGSPAVSPA